MQHKVLFATNRASNDHMFGTQRSDAISYGEVTVAVPPLHKIGVVEYPTQNPDPKADFGVITATTTQKASQFKTLLHNQIRTKPVNERTAVVYVHGFNNTFSEALFLNTQIMHDYDRPEIPVMFSWPSAGESLAYLHDRDSILASRSALETLLDQLQASDLERFILVGHSMGAHLVMETLRQHAIRTGQGQWSKLGMVALISPDIDLKVFEQQTAEMGGLPQPFLVVSSKNDRLLALSGIISSTTRVGGINPSDTKITGDATVMSSTFATQLWSVNHTTAFTSPEMIAYLSAFEGQTAQTR